MASDNNANYSKIGLSIVLAVGAISLTLVYLGGARKDNRFITETYCPTAVTGLSVGSEVNFRGVKVGEVSEITFVGREYDGISEIDGRQILIRMALNARHIQTRRDSSPEESLKRFVEHGLRATVTSSGITGLSKIELDYPKTTTQAPPITWEPEYPCIPPAPSILDSFSQSASKVMKELQEMDFSQTWSNLNSIVTSVAQIADSLGAFVDTQKTAVGDILTQVEQAGAQMRELMDELKENPSLLLRSSPPLPLPETR